MKSEDPTKLITGLINFIRFAYSPEEKTKESKEGEKTIFFRKGGKSLCYIETKNGVYTVTVVIGASLNEKVQQADISLKAKDIFKKAKQFHDGKWLFFEIKTNRDIDDVKSLLAIKRPLRKK
ncbi:hypothetical protein A2716_02355 [candidate division WWE3 bacterium RIFCSPHIGHO2_01_FULL_40_23]|uniref:DUF3788 family protein n=1 Tax=candidate division WWE3 bacterium RIFCSPLOWO2_01_FULL_41_18 TaxID=1802625 RepID=A0A1F4VF64_UNCKA|nr:MAG: hypothetical protein A2716_02355 [candidate division WWE3 bacterium RIFCSPHIGHO2_01_FULL_40_23]OGC55827.1 MAG: hypothetical protein A3A78_02205 [candidate division WWE3 bacterium RIFCSPLOWO2_01_FULL_41_18]